MMDHVCYGYYNRKKRLIFKPNRTEPERPQLSGSRPKVGRIRPKGEHPAVLHIPQADTLQRAV